MNRNLINPMEKLAFAYEKQMEEVNEIILQKIGSHVKLIPEISEHLITSGGKRIRPLLTIACTDMFGYQGGRHYRLAASVEFIHTATLLHDDVVDSGTERRGKPTANILYGNLASVLVGDFLFSRAFQLMVSDGSLEVLRILSDASAVISEGEVMQISTTGNTDTKIPDYEKVIKAKTAELFGAACEIAPVIAGIEDLKTIQSIRQFGINLGMAFQIADDVLDYRESESGKKTGIDFMEGKLTAPVILAIQEAKRANKSEELSFWQRTLADKNQEPADFEKACEIMSSYSCLEKSIEMAKTYTEKAVTCLCKAPECPTKEILKEIAVFSSSRDY